MQTERKMEFEEAVEVQIEQAQRLGGVVVVNSALDIIGPALVNYRIGLWQRVEQIKANPPFSMDKLMEAQDNAEACDSLLIMLSSIRAGLQEAEEKQH